ncbi:MAG: hypothetical protein ER33_13050 [Cyanobium sp. CACIAM 14]|nr:MAG: hypothetical protein ER33_13050 [Cyanobium sp. CACIAM 14]
MPHQISGPPSLSCRLQARQWDQLAQSGLPSSRPCHSLQEVALSRLQAGPPAAGDRSWLSRGASRCRNRISRFRNRYRA